MIKKLRIKFVWIVMLSVTIVLTIILTGINVYNFSSMINKCDHTLYILKINDGKFPEKRINNGDNGPGGDMSPELPYTARFFTVFENIETEEIINVNVDKIAAVNKEDAVTIALMIDKKEGKGFINKHYRYLVSEKDNTRMYIFLEVRNELETTRNFLLTSVIVGLVGLIAIFILSIILSRVAIKPFLTNYEKQKRFITDANHELKTPLTIIDANCDVIVLENGESEWTKSIKEQVSRLTALTNKLVFLSKMDEENKKTIMTDFSLSEVIDNVAKSYNSLAIANEIDYKYNIAKNITFCGDMSMIQELINILLENAFKYVNEKGKITLDFDANKKKKIVIYNTVDEVPSGNLDVLFERFYRLDDSRNSKKGGFGLGLSMAKVITELHKGKISAYSKDGKSIAFTITLN